MPVQTLLVVSHKRFLQSVNLHMLQLPGAVTQTTGKSLSPEGSAAGL